MFRLITIISAILSLIAWTYFDGHERILAVLIILGIAITMFVTNFIKLKKEPKILGYISIWGKTEPIILNSKPIDDFPDGDYLVDVNEFDKSDLKSLDTVEGKLEVVRRGAWAIPSGTLKALLRNFSHLERVSREKQIYMLKIFREAKLEIFNAKCSEVQAQLCQHNAEVKLVEANNLKNQGNGAAAGAVAGATVGALFGGVGAPIGAAIGALGGGLMCSLLEDESDQPKQVTKLEIEKLACEQLGWSSGPENEIEKEILKKSVELNKFDLAIVESSISTYEALLRRAFHSYSDSLEMADLVSAAYIQSKEYYEQAKALFGEGSEKFLQAQSNFKIAEEHFARARNSIILTAIVVGIVEGCKEYGGMSTREFRKELKAKGIDLSGLDIDHIIPKSKGGVDHSWNYQAVNSSLNRSWQDGHLFEKCLRDPIGFAAGLFVSHGDRVGFFVGIYDFINKDSRTSK